VTHFLFSYLGFFGQEEFLTGAFRRQGLFAVVMENAPLLADD